MTTAIKSSPSANNHQPKTTLKLIQSYTLHEEDVVICEQYHIPYQKSYSSRTELAAVEELIGEYLDLLADARSLGIYWDTNSFDLEGLKDAIEDYHISEGEEKLASHYHQEMRRNLWSYYSSLGVL